MATRVYGKKDGEAGPAWSRAPGARRLCSERVYGCDLEIHWQSHATPAALEQVASFYERKLKARFRAERHDSRTLKVGEVTLTLYPGARQASFPSCSQRPRPGERTVVFVHRGLRRSPATPRAAGAPVPPRTP